MYIKVYICHNQNFTKTFKKLTLIITETVLSSIKMRKWDLQPSLSPQSSFPRCPSLCPSPRQPVNSNMTIPSEGLLRCHSPLYLYLGWGWHWNCLHIVHCFHQWFPVTTTATSTCCLQPPHLSLYSPLLHKLPQNRISNNIIHKLAFCGLTQLLILNVDKNLLNNSGICMWDLQGETFRV